VIVVWRITTHCNLACPFCAYDRRLPFGRTHADPAAIRRFLHTLADYQQNQGDPVLVSWLGGEPLLWSELPALSTHATGLGLRISATTNGSTLGSTSVRRHLIDHYAELTVSLDAPGPGHDALRSAPGLFAALRENVAALVAARRASDRPLKIRINTVLLRDTLGSFPALAREVTTWGADELTFNLLGGRDRPEYFASQRPQPEQWARFAEQLPLLRAELGPRGLAIAGSAAYLDRLKCAGADLAYPVADCAPGERFLFIDERGLVSPCSFTTDGLGLSIAEVDSAAALAGLPARFTLARNRARPCACEDCPSTQVFKKFSPAAA